MCVASFSFSDGPTDPLPFSIDRESINVEITWMAWVLFGATLPVFRSISKSRRSTSLFDGILERVKLGGEYLYRSLSFACNHCNHAPLRRLSPSHFSNTSRLRHAWSSPCLTGPPAYGKQTLRASVWIDILSVYALFKSYISFPLPRGWIVQIETCLVDRHAFGTNAIEHVSLHQAGKPTVQIHRRQDGLLDHPDFG